MLKRSDTDLHDADDVRLFTVEQVAGLLNLGKTFVTRLITDGAIVSMKIGRTRRVRLADLRTFVDRYAVSIADGENGYRPIAPRPAGNG